MVDPWLMNDQAIKRGLVIRAFGGFGTFKHALKKAYGACLDIQHAQDR
jgi:hypothetical protein